MKKLSLILCMALASTILFAQGATESTSEAPTKDYSSDTASPEAVMLSLIDVISGPKDVPRDWDRFRNLFLPTAHLGLVAKSPDGKDAHRMFSIDDFIRIIGPNYAKTGFLEEELGHSLEEWNKMATGMQSYEWNIPDTDKSQRGINTYQMIFSGGRWHITHLVFASEDEENPIPEKYLN